MKNKKLNFAICGILTLLMLAGGIWFMCEWLPKIEVSKHILEVVVLSVVLVLLFIIAIVFFYNTTAHSTKFAVKKGFNTAFSIIFFVAAALAIAFGVMQITSYYTASEKLISVLIYGIASTVIGIAALIIALFIKRKNIKVITTEDKLKKFNAEPEKVETFNDKKVNKTCEFCGCRLSADDKVCPNCQAKIK